jgi:hypothetical protein
MIFWMRVAAERIFAERATHAFPPSAALPAEWRQELENLAQELGYRTPFERHVSNLQGLAYSNNGPFFATAKHERDLKPERSLPNSAYSGRITSKPELL